MVNTTDETVTIPLPGGEMGAFIAKPPTGSGPGIIMLQEIFGVNDAMKAKARRFAEKGYLVLIPDLFWRLEPNVSLGYSEEERAQAFAHLNNFDKEQGVKDICSAYAYLKAQENCMGAPAFVGFCLGGKLAVLAGAAEPEASAVSSFYGGTLDQNIAELKSLQMPSQLHFGTLDTHIPLDTAQAIAKEMDAKDNVAVHIYEGAQHGFFNKVRDAVYHAPAAEKAFERTLSILPGA